MTQNLIDLYNRARSEYYAGTPVMTDNAFDSLERQLAVNFPELLSKVGSVERGGKVKLPVMMGSLDQIHSEDALIRWANKYPAGTVAINSQKIDGNSNLLQYKNGVLVNSFSRGNGIEGANNIRHTSRMGNIPRVLSNTFTGEVRGEIVISKELWPAVKLIAEAKEKKVFKNARNFVAGFMNASESNPDLYKYFTFVAFEAYGIDCDKDEMFKYLKTNGFTIPVFTESVVDEMSYDTYQTMVVDIVDNSEFECDGVVVEINNRAYRTAVTDPDDLNPTYARKIKPPSKAESTTVTKIELALSKDGYVKPVIWFEPVELTGVTITKCSGFNMKFIYDNKLQPGSIILVERRGDVIPYCAEIISSGPLS